MWRIYKKLAEEKQREAQAKESVAVDDVLIDVLKEDNHEFDDSVLESSVNEVEEIGNDALTVSEDVATDELIDIVLKNPLDVIEETNFFDDNFEEQNPNQLIEQEELSAQELLEERLRVIGDIANKPIEKTPVNDENTAGEEDLSKFDFKNLGEEVTTDFSDSIEADAIQDYTQEEVDKDSNESFLEDEEQLVEEDVNFTDGVLVEPVTEEIGSDALSAVNNETNQNLEVSASPNNFINITYIDELFSFLKKEYKEAFIAGVVYVNRTDDSICNFNVTDDQISFFRMLTTELNSAVSRSNFSKIDSGYMLDLNDGKALMVLTFSIHHMVVVFDQNVIDIGYLQSVVKPYIIAEHNKALDSRADYTI